MKKVLSILAVLTLTIGLFSCESETNVEETEALFENLEIDTDATDGDVQNDDDRTQ